MTSDPSPDLGNPSRLSTNDRSLRRGAVLSFLLHALIVLLMVASLSALWLLIGSLFENDSTPWSMSGLPTTEDTHGGGRMGALPAPTGSAQPMQKSKQEAVQPSQPQTPSGVEKSANRSENRPERHQPSQQHEIDLPTNSVQVEIVRPEDVMEATRHYRETQQRQQQKPAERGVPQMGGAGPGTGGALAEKRRDPTPPPADRTAVKSSASDRPSPASRSAEGASLPSPTQPRDATPLGAGPAAEQRGREQGAGTGKPKSSASDATAEAEAMPHAPGPPPLPEPPKPGADLPTILAYLPLADPHLGDTVQRMKEAEVKRSKPASPISASDELAKVEKSSFERIQVAAKLGHPHAEYVLAVHYLLGRGTAPDVVRATEWLRKAAERNYTAAQILLGYLKARGIGTPRDLPTADLWFMQAAESGNKAAAQAQKMIEPLMSARDILEAKRMASTWRKVMAEVDPVRETKMVADSRAEELRDAASQGDLARVRMLLALGVDAQDTDTDGKTALINAAWRGQEKVVSVLLEFGTDPAYADPNGLSALGWAAVNGHDKVVQALIDAGADINRQDHDGLTPLMRAAWNGHLDIVQTLLKHGADPAVHDKERNTALDYATKEKYGDIIAVLKRSHRERQ